MVSKRLGTLLALLAIGACGHPGTAATSSPSEPPESATSVEGSLPDPEDGYRWVSRRNVAAQVPESWVHASEPGSDWCVGWDGSEESHARRPYVDVGPDLGGTLAIACASRGGSHDRAFGPAPDFLWATHLAMERADGSRDRSISDDWWTLTSRTVGEVRLRLLTDSAHRDEADRVLASARVFVTDQNGCDASSPIQARKFVRPVPFDVTEIREVDSISICQYARGVPFEAPGLMASRRIAGPDSTSLLTGLQGAPTGRGPEEPNSCTHTMYGDTGVALRLHTASATHDVFLYYDWCFGSGTDDGITRRQLTADTCAPVFASPVVAWSYSSIASKVCR